ncbi:MAG: DNA polymerase III subunit epsilon [Xanthomonadales bacterium]|nr:DNA polymerase III subunit epsilon [Xanthomonadales bacterium]
MRQVVLDTETTGLEPELGHRIIEIGAVELNDRRLTGNHFHRYLNPDRDIDEGALEVHGITREFLDDKPRFSEVLEEFLAFIDGAQLVIHNAPFDLGFLDYEISLVDRSLPALSATAEVLDSLELARELHPGQRNNLDALCKRYEVDNATRTLHGALLDAEILADVYLAMTGGQEDLGLTVRRAADDSTDPAESLELSHLNLTVIRATSEEVKAHEARLRDIQDQSGSCAWLDMERESLA